MSTPIRLFLLDAPVLCRRALAALLNRRTAFAVVGEAGSGPEALAQVGALRPDVLLVEPDLPGGGPELIAALCQALPESAVLVLTLGRAERTIARSLQAGARGYLLKECEPEDLVRTIHRVHAGELVLAREVAAAILPEKGDGLSRAPGLGGLSARELEVLGLVAQGLTNAQIARVLSITEHTVKGYLVQLLRKLGAENRVQLATYALQQGLAVRASEAIE